MKSKIILSVFLFVLTVTAGAQIIHDPNGDIYKDIDIWIVQGFIKSPLPSIRPYPAPIIDLILDDVIEYGTESAKQKASRYKESLGPGSRFIHVGMSAHVQGNSEDYGLLGTGYAEGLFRINELFSTSYNFTAIGMTDVNGERFNVPGTYSVYPDLMSDTSNIGKIEIRQNWTSLTAFGKSNVYLQAGISRSSFGPFFDNGLVVGPQAPRAGHFGFAYLRPMWSYEILFQVLSASDDFGQGHFPGKYNSIHNLSFRPIKSLELGFVQSMVYGERIELLYLVPFIFMFGAEHIIDFGDNAQMGLHFNWRPFDSFAVKGMAYVDDLHFNNLVSSGSLDAKAAGQVGITWAPKNTFLSKLDFDYTGVLPYCYTHWTQDDDNRYNGYDGSDIEKFRNPEDPSKPENQLRKPNYLNYTHFGRNIGPDLEPNSDRISLRTRWNFIPSVDVNLGAYFIRHGNASDGRKKMDERVHDGSIFDDGCSDPWPNPDDPDGNNFETDYKRSRKQPYGFDYWLTQSKLEMRLGGTLCAAWLVPSFPFGVFKLIGEYGAEYGWNRGLVKDNNSLEQYWSMGFIWSW